MSRRLKSKKGKVLCMLREVAMIVIIAIAIPIIANGAQAPLVVGVQQINSDSLPSDATFTYRLKPLQLDNPMPMESKELGYIFTITGNNNVEFVFTENIRTGVFTYELYQLIDEEEPGVIYDRRIYQLELRIDSDEVANLIVYCEEGLKVGDIKFENGFNQEEEEPTDDPEDDPEDEPTPGKPSDDRPNQPGKRPLTGDSLSIGGWLAIAGVSIAGITLSLILLIKKRKKKREIEDIL